MTDTPVPATRESAAPGSYASTGKPVGALAKPPASVVAAPALTREMCEAIAGAGLLRAAHWLFVDKDPKRAADELPQVQSLLQAVIDDLEASNAT